MEVEEEEEDMVEEEEEEEEEVDCVCNEVMLVV